MEPEFVRSWTERVAKAQSLFVGFWDSESERSSSEGQKQRRDVISVANKTLLSLITNSFIGPPVFPATPLVPRNDSSSILARAERDH